MLPARTLFRCNGSLPAFAGGRFPCSLIILLKINGNLHDVKEPICHGEIQRSLKGSLI
jgi:hypothetical protein